VEGYGTDDPRPFQLGGSAGAAPALPLLGEALAGSPFNRRVYPLRGYPEGLAALAGRRMRLASLEWRFPIARTERGIMTPPLALHQWSGTLFADSGGAWQEGGAPSAYRSGAGLELNFDSALFYSLRFNLRLGYAHGFDAGGEDQVYLRIGVPF
jgi:outer membrane protein assembly factor BamA